MKRREFLGVLGGAVAAWPVVAQGQQADRVRRVGVIMAVEGGDPQIQGRLSVLRSGLQQLGWIEGRNLRIEYRSGAGSQNIRKNIAELITLAPDVLLSAGTASAGPLLQATRNLPIVFVNVADPVGAGFVESMGQPGGNATGLMQFEYNLSGKWLELLKEIAPRVTRAVVLRDPTLTSGIGQFAVIQSVAPSLGLDVRPVNMRDLAEIERGITAFARSGSGGLIVTGGASGNVNRHRIIALAAQHKLPAVYVSRIFIRDGGLVSYGPNPFDQFREAATYIDRILKGEKPADLPVQAPTKYELVINLKTAKVLSLTVPPTLLARADEVIE